MSRIIPTFTPSDAATFVSAARALVGVEFGHRGRSLRKLDCLGMVVRAMRAVGHEMEDRKAYGRDPSRDGIRQAAIAHFGPPLMRKPINLDALRAADVLLMKWHDQPNHVAVVGEHPLGGLTLIHALREEGRVVEHRLDHPWPRRILEAYRP